MSLRELGIAGRRVAILLAAFAGDALKISAGAECSHWVRRQIARFSPLLNRGPHIMPKGSAQSFLGIHQRALLLKSGEAAVIYQSCARVEFLRGTDGLNHRFDFSLEIVTLVDHVGC